MSAPYNWTDEYREIIELYWWQPQSFGRAKTNPKKFPTADKMWESVARLETTLNHVLNIFFALFPFEKLNFPLKGDKYTMLSSKRLEEIQREMDNKTQPDFFFVGDNSNLAIELKLGAKSDIEQVEKYVAFHRHLNRAVPLHLLYLSPHEDVKGLFSEHFQDERELRTALDSGVNQELSLHFMSIADFDKMLGEVDCENSIETKLTNGIREYLREHLQKYLS